MVLPGNDEFTLKRVTTRRVAARAARIARAMSVSAFVVALASGKMAAYHRDGHFTTHDLQHSQGGFGMRTLYYSPGGFSMAAHIVMEESGEKYQPQQGDLAGGEQRTEAYLKINPLGRVPA